MIEGIFGKVAVQLVALFLNTQEFCATMDVHQSTCLVDVIECSLSVDEDFCQEDFLNMYEGI